MARGGKLCQEGSKVKKAWSRLREEEGRLQRHLGLQLLRSCTVGSRLGQRRLHLLCLIKHVSTVLLRVCLQHFQLLL